MKRIMISLIIIPVFFVLFGGFNSTQKVANVQVQQGHSASCLNTSVTNGDVGVGKRNRDNSQCIRSIDERSNMLHFTSSGQLIRFSASDFILSNGKYALQVKFLGTKGVKPIVSRKQSMGNIKAGKTQPLDRVIYKELWKGIELEYHKTAEGVLESNYIVSAVKGKTRDIRLKYNVPVEVDHEGNLMMKFKTCELRESKPVAWQVKNEQKIPVEVNYVVNNEKEVGFAVSIYDPGYDLIIDPILKWNTFLGGIDRDEGNNIIADDNGNIYIVGVSLSTWGNPVNSFLMEGWRDVFVAKLNSNGILQWNTFMGGYGEDYGNGIIIDSNKNIYVIGTSQESWGKPLNPHSGGYWGDAFVAKIDSQGILKWNTFLGGESSDYGNGITLDANGNIYVIGESWWGWGKPVNPFNGYDWTDTFVAKLNSKGVRQWNTFMGGSRNDVGSGIVTDVIGNIYVTGYSGGPWGNAINPFSGGLSDAFVAKLNSNGIRLWNTFLGGEKSDLGIAIDIDISGNIYVIGDSYATWGSPVNPGHGGFVAKITHTGLLQWNTFGDNIFGIDVDSNGNSFVTGRKLSGGSPYKPLYDVYAARLNSDGVIHWEMSLGGSGDDYSNGIYKDGKGNLYITGYSEDTWGSPVNPHNGKDWSDVFVAKIYDGTDISTYKITLNRENLYFGSLGNISPRSQTLLISSNSSLSTVPNWSITDNQNWLSCNPTNGAGPGLVTVTVNSAGLSVGNYTGVITVSDPNATNSPQKINVNLSVYGTNQTTEPFGDFATPINGSTVSSSIAVTGWVLDDIGVESVKIHRSEGKNKVYIGDAVFVEGARPDVEQAYPTYPNNYKAGWGYMLLTNFLPNNGNGTFTLHAIATDLEGNQVTLGTKTILVDNANAVKPFGAIDTPTQGGIASGSNYRNWGWVLTPQPNMIPTNGSTINVWVDGIQLGHTTYNIYRSDIASLFPGYANSNGAAGYFDIDTTAYNNGVHTIQWTAADNGGNTDGIGSRYFTIRNTGSSQSSSAAMKNTFSPGYNDLSDIPISYDEPVKFKKGYTDDYWSEALFPGTDGITHIQCKELEMIDIQVFHDGIEVEGYMLVGNRLRSLPIGSTLEKMGGRFRWIPGPGFVGTYSLVFIETNQYGKKSRKNFLVTIEPIFSRE